MKRCTQCGRENMDHENFCSGCGNALQSAPASRTCPSCHAPVAVDDRFCDDCGATLPEMPADGIVPSVAHTPPSTRPMGGVTSPPPMGQQYAQQGGYTPQPSFHPASMPPPPKKSKLPLIISAVVALLLVAGGLSYYFLIYKKDSGVTAPVTPDPVVEQPQTPPPSKPQEPTNKKDGTKPVPPPTSNTNTNLEPLGFMPMTTGKLEYPLQFYQAVDFDGDGVMEFVVGTTDASSGHVDILAWERGNFVRVGFFDVPGPIYEMNASVVGKGAQQLYIPSADGMLYTLAMENGKYVYYEEDLMLDVLSIAEGYFDGDRGLDFAVLNLNADGSQKISFIGSKESDIPPLTSDYEIFNMFLADVDGDGVSDLLYLAQDDEGIYHVYVAAWMGRHYELVGGSTFGGDLINFYPGDVDGDGMSEIVTTNLTEDLSAVEGLIWKWDDANLQFILVDIFAIDVLDNMSAFPIVGDFTGDGHVDIMILRMNYYNDEKDFVIYSR